MTVTYKALRKRKKKNQFERTRKQIDEIIRQRAELLTMGNQSSSLFCVFFFFVFWEENRSQTKNKNKKRPLPQLKCWSLKNWQRRDREIGKKKIATQKQKKWDDEQRNESISERNDSFTIGQIDELSNTMLQIATQ